MSRKCKGDYRISMSNLTERVGRILVIRLSFWSPMKGEPLKLQINPFMPRDFESSVSTIYMYL